MGRRKHTKQHFVDFINKNVPGHQLDFSLTEYKNRHTKVKITCRKHGPFEKLPNEIFNHKSGCSRCEVLKRNSKNTIGTNEFINRAKSIHGEKYSYDNVVYERSNKKVSITCPQHGDFLQTPTAHISQEQGCNLCYLESKKGVNHGGYSQEYFDANPEIAQQPAMVYIIQMNCETDRFLKVGITRRTIKERYQRTHVGDKYIKKEILVTKYMSLFNAFRLEQQILQELKDYKYYPNYVFDGRTECLKNKPEVIQRIQNLMESYETI